MSPRRIAFLLGFVVIPAIFWVLLINPALARRTQAIQRQANAGVVVAEANKAVQHRDQLQTKWEAFKPLAEKALANMEHDLNPLLVPRRIASLAENTYNLKDLRIQPVAGNTEDLVSEFSFTATGNYEDLVGFLDELERGKQRVRFQNLKIMIQPGHTSPQNPTLNLAASFLVPTVPNDPSSAGQARGAELTANEEVSQ